MYTTHEKYVVHLTFNFYNIFAYSFKFEFNLHTQIFADLRSLRLHRY